MSDTDDNTPCDFEAELPLLLYQGELAREERERLKSHLATCARCGEALAQLEATAVVLDGAMAVPKPTDDQWKKLKLDVLSRVATPATAAPTSSGQAASADAVPADEACEAIEEDLLVLNEVGAARKKEVAAHLDRCASCRDARSAFGSIGMVLNREPLVWPSIERWDSLKENVVSTIDGELRRTKESARIQPAAPPVRRVSWGTFARAAAGVILLVGVTGSFALLRGPSADEVRRLYREAQGGGTLAVVARNYELVIQQGIDKPECRTEVDDALLQVQAIHHFDSAMSQPDRELKVIQLRDGITRWPSARVTELALAKYNELVPVVPQATAPDSGFGRHEKPGDLRFEVDIAHIHRIAENLESQFVSLERIADEKLRAKKESELRGALGPVFVQLGQSEVTSHEAALGYYKKALAYAVPNSPAALDAKKHVDQLSR